MSTRIRLILAVLGGFTASFLALVGNTYLQFNDQFRSQLLAGDPSLNKDYPTTLNTMHGAMDAGTAVSQMLGSTVFWVLIGFGTLLGAWILFRVMQRYA